MSEVAPQGLACRMLATLRLRLVLTWRNMVAQDYLLSGFHLYLFLRVLTAPSSKEASVAWWAAAGLLSLTGTMLLLCRGELLPRGPARGIVYRVLAIHCVFLAYFELRALLPALQSQLLDAWLLSLDQALFGGTPARWSEAWITAASTQWFSFFYYSYVWLLALNVVGSAAFDRNHRRMHEMLFGSGVIAMLGHLVFTIVPCAGPQAFLSFQREIPNVFWWTQVLAIVGHAEALFDIFPSLHTALPLFFALHALRHRRSFPFNYLWPVSTFFAVNIIIAAAFLRWHYAVDIIAGLVLAALAQWLAVHDVKRDRRRLLSGGQPALEGVRAEEYRAQRPDSC
jgi:hypothetical protein